MTKEYKKIIDKYKKVCDKLNEILENKTEDFIDKINDIIYNEVFKCNGDLYVNRQLYIENGFDINNAKELIKTQTNKVMFIPSDDPEEHPGITFIYKPEFRNENI